MISPWFWIYWIITIPATLIVLGLWLIWRVRIKNIQIKKNKEIEEIERREEMNIQRLRFQPLEAILSDL